MNGITPPNAPNNPSPPDQEVTDGDCAICHEPFAGKEVKVLEQCDHKFHKDCLDRWLSESQTCPLCRARARIGDRQVQPLLMQPAEPGSAQSTTFSQGSQIVEHISDDTSTIPHRSPIQSAMFSPEDQTVLHINHNLRTVPHLRVTHYHPN